MWYAAVQIPSYLTMIPSKRLANPHLPTHIIVISSHSTEMNPLLIKRPQQLEEITLIAHPRPLIA